MKTKIIPGQFSHKMLRPFRSFKFESGSRISDKKPVVLELEYLQNKKW